MPAGRYALPTYKIINKREPVAVVISERDWQNANQGSSIRGRMHSRPDCAGKSTGNIIITLEQAEAAGMLVCAKCWRTYGYVGLD